MHPIIIHALHIHAIHKCVHAHKQAHTHIGERGDI